MVLIGLMFTGGCFAADLADSQKQLEQINKELKSLQQTLAKQNKDASKVRQALQSIEKDMATLQVNIKTVGRDIQTQEQEITDLQNDQANLELRLADKQDEISNILRLAYKQNNYPLIKLLLSGERPEDISRHLYYFSVLTQNQQNTLSLWVDEQRQLNQLVLRKSALLADVKTQKKALVSKQDELSTQKARRQQVMASLEEQGKNTSKEIERKNTEREKMAAMIAELQAKLDEMSLDFPEGGAVSKVKGKLPWPVAGRLVNRYGRAIEGSALTWQGWLISAPSGTDVKAVHRGRVVFADFFKSHGLLIIIDHGNGIWTLYGRNQALLTDVGRWVEAGDVIAEVGQSGGYSQSGLYFEVRSNGEPVNPAVWLANR